MVSFILGLEKVFCKKSFKSLALTALMVSSLGLPQNAAHAQTVGPGCDPEFMKSMQKKAWMEAQREIMIAQTTIAKPDSVFSLGCFGNFTSGFEIKFGSGNDYKYADALDKYIKTAFNHTYGGGHYTGKNSSTNDKCEDMQNLWNAARKSDLDQPSKLLGTLQDIATYDRGAFPIAFPAPPGFGKVGDKATPLGTFYGTKDSKKSLGAAFDDMNLFANVTAPMSETSGKTCSAGIETGIKIGEKRPEIICPNPGCVSDGAETPKCVAYK